MAVVDSENTNALSGLLTLLLIKLLMAIVIIIAYFKIICNFDNSNNKQLL